MNTDIVSSFCRVERRDHALDRTLARLATQLNATEVKAVGIFEPFGKPLMANLPITVQTVESEKRLYGPTARFSDAGRTFEVTTWTDGYGQWLLGSRTCDRRQYPRLLARRERDAASFTKEEALSLTPLLPHMLDHFALHHDFNSLRAEVSHLTGALDYLPIAMMLVNDEMKIVAANSSAKRILAAADGLSQKNGRLSLRKNEIEQLHDAIVLQRDFECYIERSSPKAPYVVRVISATKKRYSATTLATLTIRDSGAAPATNSPLLSKVFGLTKAEARLAQALVCGASLPDAAKNLGVTHNTVRTHMKRIFEKTGLNRQAELVRLLSGMLSEA